jgi:histidinol phosphatase-like enzyme (inositol monophosphatase family)
MPRLELADLAGAAEAAADRARAEILPRFRRVRVEEKADGSPVTEADRAAERAVREVLREATPAIPVVGEEYGGEGAARHWLVDPIDGTLTFARGIPLFATLLSLVEEGEPLLGLIDLPTLGERYLGYRGGGCRRNGRPVTVSQHGSLAGALVAHGDVSCFELAGRRAVFERLAREISLLRGYTDGFGHAQVIGGGVDAMIDLWLNPWDAAPAQVLVSEAGGRCETLALPGGKLGLVFGSPPVVEALLPYLEG